jgi:hypothetical protein
MGGASRASSPALLESIATVVAILLSPLRGSSQFLVPVPPVFDRGLR